jgi:hypothetical protein
MSLFNRRPSYKTIVAPKPSNAVSAIPAIPLSELLKKATESTNAPQGFLKGNTPKLFPAAMQEETKKEPQADFNDDAARLHATKRAQQPQCGTAPLSIAASSSDTRPVLRCTGEQGASIKVANTRNRVGTFLAAKVPTIPAAVPVAYTPVAVLGN